MSDLISRSAVIDIIHKEIQRTTSWIEHDTQINIKFAVEELPTAYNVEQVVKELEAETTALEDDYGDYVECIPESIVLKIVKGGGINERD